MKLVSILLTCIIVIIPIRLQASEKIEDLRNEVSTLKKENELLMLRDFYHIKKSNSDEIEKQEMRTYINKQSREHAGRMVAGCLTSAAVAIGIAILVMWTYGQNKNNKTSDVRYIR